MTSFYADTSILLKQHVDELGSAWFRNLVSLPDAVITTTELSRVEVYSAFNRLVREGQLSNNSYQELTTRLRGLFASRYETIAISAYIINIACDTLERHPLRAYDAIHLASALFVNQEFLAAGKPGLTFLTADLRLLTAATAEGLSTFNPATT